jgi:transcriptional regulator of acetoin/glycerol metabolism
MEAVERDAIVNALRDASGNRAQAAATLGIAHSCLHRKLKSFGICTIQAEPPGTGVSHAC